MVQLTKCQSSDKPSDNSPIRTGAPLITDGWADKVITSVINHCFV